VKVNCDVEVISGDDEDQIGKVCGNCYRCWLLMVVHVGRRMWVYVGRRMWNAVDVAFGIGTLQSVERMLLSDRVGNFCPSTLLPALRSVQPSVQS